MSYMHLVIKCPDRDGQLRLLKVGYDWFVDKLDPRLKYKSEINYVEQLQKVFQQNFGS
jgi:hypothetical protein